MNYSAVSGLVNGIIATVIGIFVYSRNTRDLRYITYGLLCLSVSIWSYFYFFWAITEQEHLSLLFCRLLMAGAIFIPITGLHHIVSLLELGDKNKKLIIFGYISSFVFLITDFTPLFIKDVSPKLSFKFWSNPGGIFFHVYIFMFFLAVFYSILLVFRTYRNSAGVIRNQMKYLLIAMSIGYFGGLTNFPLWYDIPIYPFGTIFFSIYVAIFAYAIIRYRLMDIQVVFSKTLVAILLGAGVIGFDILFVRLLYPLIGYYPAHIISMSVVGYVLFATPLSRKLQLGVDQMVLKGKYDYQNMLREASKTVITILNMNELVNYTINVLRQSFGLDKVALLMKTKDGVYRLEYGYGIGEQLRGGYEIKNGMIELAKNKKEIFVKEEHCNLFGTKKFNRLYKDMGKIGAELMVPLFCKGELEGVLTLSCKGTGEPYVQGDIDLLETLGSQVSIAMRNSRLYEEAVTDSSTGLCRHEYFQLRFSKKVEESMRCRHFLSLLVIDLDCFKEINDTYGHQVGDVVLKRLAIILKEKTRKADIVAQYGVEGFSVILVGTNARNGNIVKERTDYIEEIKLTAEKLRKEVEQEEFVVGPTEHRAAPTSIKMTISIGIAYFDGVGSGSESALTARELIKYANSALCRAKENGGNRVEVW
ncbi:MAG: diguanylate cyclase [Candidatus Omnitrophota bacterium]